MNKEPTILIASDNAEDAKMIKQQLAHDYEHIFISSNGDVSAQDFEAHIPDVLVLAFDTLEKAECYNLGLYRLSKAIHSHPHRTVVLCNKDEIKRAYELCKKQNFDDYVHYWPMTHDATRLAMSIHLALRHLTGVQGSPSSTEFAAQARRLAELESLLEWNATQSNAHVENACHSISGIEQQIKDSFNHFQQPLKQDEILGHFNAAKASITPLKSLAQELKHKLAPHLQATQTLTAMAKNLPATIMVVDDDEMARKLLKSVLSNENYALMIAASGIEALAMLRNRRPDLILMDMMMPEIDGMETTQRIKSAERFASIPIIMVTCNSEKNIVANCLKAGAADFVVKPFNREILLDKIHKFLN